MAIVQNVSGIYKIVNLITREFYIGSAVNLVKREREHFSLLNNNLHPNYHLQNSFNKHGEENFKFEILEYCEKENLIIREQYYLDTLKPQYNICKIAGSQLGMKRSEESLRKRTLSRSGFKHTEEAKKKISIATKGKFHSQEVKEKIRQSNLGKKLSDETKNKIRSFNIGRQVSIETRQKMAMSSHRKGYNSKPILCFDKNRLFIREFPSLSSARILNSMLRVSYISQVCKGKVKSTCGYIFQYK